MKKTTYFGNRFKAALRGFRAGRSNKQLSTVTATPAAPEFEALESRILLSGIGTGLNKKSVTFLDADGDKVTVTALGKGAKFNIDLGGSKNNADIANIEIAAAGTSVGVVVSPVGSFTAPVQTKQFINPNWNLGNLGGAGNLSLDNLNQTNQKIQTQYYNLTPGWTNIGSITAADGITEVGSIGLTAAVVPVIDLPGVAVGNINLSTGMVTKVDAFMATNGSYLQNYGGWTPGIQNINIYDINAGSIAGINISGIDPNNYAGPAAFNGNDYLGTITTDAGGIGRLSGTHSQFNGQLSLGGTDAFLGNIVLGRGWAAGSSITATGDLTFTANNFNGVIDVGGHLNLGLQGASNGDFFAGKGISGLRAGTADSVVISSAFTGSLVAKGGDLAGVTVAGGGTVGATALFEAQGKIGNIWSNAALNNATIIAGTNIDSITLRGVDLAAGTKIFVGATVGNIDIANGDLNATIAAANFTSVSLRGGDLNGTILASDGIGNVTIVDGQLAGSLIAQGKAGIGNIDVTNLNGGEAIAGGAVIFSAADIQSISAATTGDTAVGNASIQAQGTIKAFEVTAYGAGGGGAIDGLTLIAPTISDMTVTSIAGTAINNSTFISTVGNVGNITATGLTGGILNSGIISAGSVGKITGKAIDTGDGIANLDITAQTGITSVTGTALKGAGIDGGTYISVTGNIGDITGSSTSPANAGNGIANLTVKAVAGTVANVTGTAAGNGNGLDGVTVQADKGITAISGSSFTGNGIDGGNYKAINGDIGSISATTSEGTAIGGGATFISVGGKINAISATPTGVGGIAVDNATFQAASIGNLDFKVTNLDGGFAVKGLDVTATNGDVGTITVTNASLAAGANGLSNSNVQATGNIGLVTVSAVADNANAIVSLNLTADSEGNDTGDVLGVKATSKGGSAIINGTYEGANVGPITADVTALNGFNAISGLTVIANVGKIDAITATTASKGGSGEGILNSTFTAETDIVSITASANTGNAIDGSTFTANEGDIGNIKATSATGNAVINATFTGENVGNKIEATVTGDGGDAIFGTNITATKGDVSDIVAITASESGGRAIINSVVLATGDIKSITATSNIGDAVDNSTATADSDGDDAGTLGNVTVTATEGSALITSNLQGAVVLNVTAKVTAAANGTEDAVSNVNITSTFGNIGNIDASVVGDGDDALQAATIVAAGDVGTITASTASESGGDAITLVTVSADNIGAITAKVTDVDGGDAIASLLVNALGTNAAEDTSTGTIGAVTVTSASANGAGIVNSTFNAGIGVNGQAIGNVEVTLTKSTGFAIDNVHLNANFDPAINGPTKAADQKATIGTIKALGANDGINALVVQAPVSIGAITSEGNDSQSVSVSAPTTGALTFNKLNNAETVSVTAGAAVTSLGAVTVEAPGGTPSNTANLQILGGGSLTTLGNIGVDGNLNLPALNTVKTAGTIGALTIQGGATVGSGAAGSSVGLITIGNGGAAANLVTFNFASMNGKTNATADATLAVDFLLGAGPDITTFQAKAPGTTVAGVTAILAV